MAKNTVEKIEDEVVVEEVAADIAQPKTKKTTRKEVRKYAPDDMIVCRSITFGELFLTGAKTKFLYSWANYGDTTEVYYQDLQALKSTRSSYLLKPRFIIEDEDLVEQWKSDLGKIYSDIIAMDVEEIFTLPTNQFKAKLKNAPVGVQQAIKNIAGEKIMNGSLDSLSKIKAIDDILGTQLRLYIS